MLKTSVVLPTLNEAQNICPLIDSCYKNIPGIFEVIVVDDHSPDGTADLVREYRRAHPERRVLIEERLSDPGLTNSLWRGMELATGDIVVWMDCDFSMPPELIPELLRCIDNGYDVAVGSRFVRGGSCKQNTEGTPDSALAVFLSRAMNYTIRYLLVPSFADHTSGFIAVRLPLVKQLKLRGDYGEYFIDLIYRAIKVGYKVIEIPYVCVPRKFGVSKTGANLHQYLKRGIKYFQVAFRLRLAERFHARPKRIEFAPTPVDAKPSVREMTAVDVPLVARLHHRVLAGTLNSNLGTDFLENLYYGVLSDPNAKAWVAVEGPRILGFLSGTLKLHETSAHMIAQTPTLMKVWAAIRILFWPPHLRSYLSRQIYNRHCLKRYGAPFPLILTVGVAPEQQSKGVGHLLLHEAESFYKMSGLKKYYVDTLADNERAIGFYTRSGFEARETVDGNILLCRDLNSGTL